MNKAYAQGYEDYKISGENNGRNYEGQDCKDYQEGWFAAQNEDWDCLSVD